ncbi:hypothetical protein [Veillonella sp. oral taxon 780]|uniref:hypothetical protein n=1 Tax=Veillonella sp. oral taxon 780 TaxID=671229 RepID=UPI00021A37E6|nr:hypothetical protein [Veillonella sp. oral taxon 780]EGS34657.1 hypothetical protein HMPREF9200_1235 [Veillonella sp. oral taxon 780 str. F0422]
MQSIQRSQKNIQKSSKKLSKLMEDEAALLRKLEILRKEKRQESKRKHNQELSHIGYIIQQLGFPINNLSILVGAILSAKEQLETNRSQTVDDYLQRYQTFLEDNTISETLREDFMYALNTDIDEHEEEVDDDDTNNIEE